MNDNAPERNHEDRSISAQIRLERMLLDGLESGSSEMTDRDWDDIRREVQSRQADRKRLGT